MKNIIFVGSHLGYAMESTPLGGGAMVGLQIVRHWARWTGFRLMVLGSGPHPPHPDINYLQMSCPSVGDHPNLVHLSECGYARFCREFERASMDYLVRNKALLNSQQNVVVVNDISESPDLSRVSGLGYKIISLWHVDVVDFFNKFYLKNILRPEVFVGIFNRLQRYGCARLVPNILRLVFEKQQQSIQYSERVVLPSRKMEEIVLSCYKPLRAPQIGPLEDRILVLPWGGWSDEFSEIDIDKEAARLRTYYQMEPDTQILITLSRISPEKGIGILMEALQILETNSQSQERDICLFVCGEPAFMGGTAYYRRVRTMADKLKKIRVFFPGYLYGFEKRAYFRLANLFVSPSVHESYGLTLVEAMHAGLPILASDHYGAREILRPEFGRIVSYNGSPQPAQPLAQALGEMLGNAEELRAMGLRAKSAAGSMSFSHTAKTLLDTVLSLA